MWDRQTDRQTDSSTEGRHSRCTSNFFRSPPDISTVNTTELNQSLLHVKITRTHVRQTDRQTDKQTVALRTDTVAVQVTSSDHHLISAQSTRLNSTSVYCMLRSLELTWDRQTDRQTDSSTEGRHSRCTSSFFSSTSDISTVNTTELNKSLLHVKITGTHVRQTDRHRQTVALRADTVAVQPTSSDHDLISAQSTRLNSTSVYCM